MRLQLIIILIMAILLVIFTFQNPHPVQMHFVGWGTQQFPLVGIILISILAGVIMSTILGLKSSSNMKRVVRELEEELDEIRTVPVSPEEEELQQG